MVSHIVALEKRKILQSRVIHAGLIVCEDALCLQCALLTTKLQKPFGTTLDPSVTMSMHRARVLEE